MILQGDRCAAPLCGEPATTERDVTIEGKRALLTYCAKHADEHDEKQPPRIFIVTRLPGYAGPDLFAQIEAVTPRGGKP